MKCAGYSIVELIGGFGVAAAVVVMGVPVVSETLEAARLRSAAWTVAIDLQVLRRKAVTARSQQELEVRSASGEPCRYVLRVPGGTEGDERTFAGGIRCELSPETVVRFDARGLAATPGTIAVRNARGQRLDVRVGATGRTEIVR